MNNKMLEIIRQRKAGRKMGIYSCCSANSYVIEAALERGLETDAPVLIEATANQVNQYGGYTGMKPADFVSFVQGLAEKTGFPKDRLILGGDHLGPLTWQNENEVQAMEKSAELLRQYAGAGFTKIHIDTSMRVADDDRNKKLSDETIARRAAALCSASEQAYKELRAKNPEAPEPVYIIGSEVPIPGGAQESEDSVRVTDPEEFVASVEAFQRAFEEQGLKDAFKRVIGVVVQPGVEFGDSSIFEYDRNAAESLVKALTRYDGIVFEGHSTDYQTPEKLKEMVSDGIAILKVGPALTFALREAIFALNSIEEEMLSGSGVMLSKFRETLERVMLESPSNWMKHYQGDDMQKLLKRKYSYSDRCRYYLPNEEVQVSLSVLIRNINSHEIPLNVLDQYLPLQYRHIREKKLALDAEAILKDRVKDTIDDYLYATIL